MGPETTDLDVGLGHGGVGVEQPGAEDRLRKHVQNSIGDDFLESRQQRSRKHSLVYSIVSKPVTGEGTYLVNVGNASTVSNAPDDRVDSPDDKGEASNGSEEVANLATLTEGSSTAVDGELPDHDEVGNAGNRVPAPLGSGLLVTESGEETGQDHDDVGNDGDEDVAAAEASEKSQVEKEEGSSHAPVNVTGPVNLTVDDLRNIWANLALGVENGLVEGDTVTNSLAYISIQRVGSKRKKLTMAK